MARPTPGPWVARWPKHDALILDAEERVIGSVQFTDHVDSECEANAYLIAAAPDMLTALEGCKQVLEFAQQVDKSAKWGDFVREAIDPALQKATGGSR